MHISIRVFPKILKFIGVEVLKFKLSGVVNLKVAILANLGFVLVLSEQIELLKLLVNYDRGWNLFIVAIPHIKLSFLFECTLLLKCIWQFDIVAANSPVIVFLLYCNLTFKNTVIFFGIQSHKRREDFLSRRLFEIYIKQTHFLFGLIRRYLASNSLSLWISLVVHNIMLLRGYKWICFGRISERLKH